MANPWDDRLIRTKSSRLLLSRNSERGAEQMEEPTITQTHGVF